MFYFSSRLQEHEMKKKFGEIFVILSNGGA